jgi:hypothetical protein
VVRGVHESLISLLKCSVTGACGSASRR